MTIFGGNRRAHLRSTDLRLEGARSVTHRRRSRTSAWRRLLLLLGGARTASPRGAYRFKTKAARLAFRAAEAKAYAANRRRRVSWLVAFERTRALRLNAAEGAS